MTSARRVTAIGQPSNDLGVGLVGIKTREGAARAIGIAHIELAVVVDRHDDGQVAAHAGVVVVNAVARRGVHAAGTVLKRHVVGRDDAARNALKDGLLVGDAHKLLALDAPRLCRRPAGT